MGSALFGSFFQINIPYFIFRILIVVKLTFHILTFCFCTCYGHTGPMRAMNENGFNDRCTDLLAGIEMLPSRRA